MPLGSKNGDTPSDAGNGEKPVIFQKYFKNGNRTYASQVKISQIGKKYLVLTEGHRDAKTQELKKHTICVFEQDLKQFFAILQETVLYLRTVKEPAGSPTAAAGKPASNPAPGNGTARPVKPPIATRLAGGNGARVAAMPAKQPAQTKAVAPVKPAGRLGPARPQAIVAPAKVAPKSTYRAGSRSAGR